MNNEYPEIKLIQVFPTLVNSNDIKVHKLRTLTKQEKEEFEIRTLIRDIIEGDSFGITE